MQLSELKRLLDEKACQYNCKDFIKNDPISIPHRFSVKEDIEISGFLTAMIAWGNRKSIINSADRMINIMDNSPFEFIKGFSERDLSVANTFVHRTFNAFDLEYFLFSLKNIYIAHDGLETVFDLGYQKSGNIKDAIIHFRKVFFELPYQKRTSRHVSDPARNSAAKRINMFLRWMVRNDNKGVDFGIWKRIPQSELFIPLDIHSGTVARKFGLLKRKQNDWKAVDELTGQLRKLDPSDPVKYDYALFGYGVNKVEGIPLTL